MLQTTPNETAGSPADAGLASRELSEAILRQMQRMLSHPTFNKSGRCKALFQYLVEKAVENRAVFLKERTLGIEVFGRDTAYDTAVDPVVRTTVNEIRKRIAQYYHETGHEAEVRIELPPGSYTPEFTFLKPSTTLASPSLPLPIDPAAEAPTPVVSLPLKSTRLRRIVALLISTAVIALVYIAWTEIRVWNPPSNNALFWAPFLASHNRILICIASMRAPLSVPSSGDPATSDVAMESVPVLPLPDAAALSTIMTLLQGEKKTSVFRGSDSVILYDLREGPVIVIGGFDNGVGLQLSSKLRYHIVRDAQAHKAYIEDASNPSRRDWSVDLNIPFNSFQKDYAVVSKYIETTTGMPVLLIQGLGPYGTGVASDFVVVPSHLNALGKQLSNCGQNVQFVIQAKIENEREGAPQVLAIHCW